VKHCPKCNCDKNESEFNKTISRISSYCKECQSAYSKTDYQKNKHKQNKRRGLLTKKTRLEQRIKIQNIKHNKPCMDCGKVYPFYVMHFDHLNNKIENIANMPGKYGWDKISEEIAKCELVCANCHSERTWGRKHKKDIE
jgi:hypothetical protein